MAITMPEKAIFLILEVADSKEVFYLREVLRAG